MLDNSLRPIEAGRVHHHIDGDGDLDIFSIGWSHNRILLYENKSMKPKR